MANTPFLDLVKPAGTDRALVSVINSNSDKIDGGVSTLSEQIGKIKVSKFDVANISALETKLAQIAENYSNYDFAMLSFSVQNGGDYFASQSGYEGMLYKNSTGYLVLDAFNHNTNMSPVLGRCYNGTWSWTKFILGSDIGIGNNNPISSTSTDSGSFKTVATITNVSSGNYLLIVDMDYGSNTSGIRILLVDTTETNTNGAINSVLATGRATLQKTRAFALTPTDTIYIRAYQSSGSSLNVSGNYRLIRLE